MVCNARVGRTTMTKRTGKTGRILQVVKQAAKANPADPHLQEVLAGTDVLDEHTQDALEMETPIAPAPKTVVKVKYKREYQDRAKARGLTDKASRRGNGDWLQRELQAECNAKDGSFDLTRFEAILDANGVDHSRWNRTTRGWEGRVRMSGSISLRGVVGKSGLLRMPDGHNVNVQKIADEGDETAQAFLAKWSN